MTQRDEMREMTITIINGGAMGVGDNDNAAINVDAVRGITMMSLWVRGYDEMRQEAMHATTET